MFLTNVLVVMRTWAASQQQLLDANAHEDWDADETATRPVVVGDTMQATAHHLFLSVVDYLHYATTCDPSERMPAEMAFDMWKRMVTNQWTMNEKVWGTEFVTPNTVVSF